MYYFLKLAYWWWTENKLALKYFVGFCQDLGVMSGSQFWTICQVRNALKVRHNNQYVGLELLSEPWIYDCTNNKSTWKQIQKNDCFLFPGAVKPKHPVKILQHCLFTLMLTFCDCVHWKHGPWLSPSWKYNLTMQLNTNTICQIQQNMEIKWFPLGFN